MKKTQTAAEPRADPAVSPLAARIMSAAFTAFMEHGYAGASTLEIATRAKVSKRELYAIFGSKREMLHACITTRTRRMRPPEPPPAASDPASAALALTAFGARLLEEVCHPAVVAVNRLAIVEAVNSPEVAEEMETARRGARTALVVILRHAQESGAIGPGAPEEISGEYYSLLMGDLLIRLMQRARTQPTPEEARARAQAATDAIQRLHPPSVDAPRRAGRKS